MPETKIRRARPGEAPTLSAIAFESKAHWRYSRAQLAAWRDDLAVAADTISSCHAYVADVDARPVGFFVLTPSSPHWELEHLWVLPRAMGRGVGRALLLHATEIAAAGGARAIRIDADPNAEPFYLACGARLVGRRPAPIAADALRERPQLLLRTRGLDCPSGKPVPGRLAVSTRR